MLLSDLQHAAVLDSDGRKVGTLIDLRFVVDGATRGLLADARLYGLVVSPHGRFSYWGYERREEGSPALIAKLLRWMHRGTFLVTWDSVAQIDEGRVIRLLPGYERLSPTLAGR